MIHEFNYCPHPDGTTAQEFSKLLSLRLETLSEATREHGMGEPLPVPWRRGWRASLYILGRDRDGSLLAGIVVTGPREARAVRRKVRLVRPVALPWSLGRE